MKLSELRDQYRTSAGALGPAGLYVENDDGSGLTAVRLDFRICATAGALPPELIDAIERQGWPPGTRFAGDVDNFTSALPKPVFVMKPPPIEGRDGTVVVLDVEVDTRLGAYIIKIPRYQGPGAVDEAD